MSNNAAMNEKNKEEEEEGTKNEWMCEAVPTNEKQQNAIIYSFSVLPPMEFVRIPTNVNKRPAHHFQKKCIINEEYFAELINLFSIKKMYF